MDSHSPHREFTLLPVFTGLFVATLLISNVAAAKIVQFGPFTTPGAVILFPLSFIFGDILTEVYGYERSRKVIWTGLACVVLAAIMYKLIGLLPAASFWTNQAAYDAILGTSLRIAVASVTAYWCGEFSNSFVLSKLKYFAEGRRGLSQAWRFIASTVVGEGVDSIIFMVIAFGGVFTTGALLKTMLSIYVLKVGYEVIATPFSVRFANWVKRIEHEDHIDTPAGTTYNPFVLQK